VTHTLLFVYSEHYDNLVATDPDELLDGTDTTPRQLGQ
jgi:hypothetical protein